MPGNRVLLRGPNNPWLVACLVRGAEGGRRRGDHHAAAAAGGDHRARRDHPDRTSPSATTASLADLTAAAPGLPALAYGGDGADDLVARCASKDGGFTAVDTAADDVALLAPPRAPPAGPRPPCTSTATCWPSPTPSRATSLRPVAGRRLHRHARRSASRSGSAAWWSSRCASAPPRCCSSGPRPDELADAIAAHGVTVLFTAPTAYRAMLAAGRATSSPACAAASRPASTCRVAVWEDVPPRHRHPHHRRDRRHRDAAHLHLRRRRRHPARRHRPGRARATRRAVLDEDGRAGARRRAGRLAVTRPDRLPLPGRRSPARVRAGRLEHHRRHLRPRRRRLLLVSRPAATT